MRNCVADCQSQSLPFPWPVVPEPDIDRWNHKHRQGRGRGEAEDERDGETLEDRISQDERRADHRGGRGQHDRLEPRRAGLDERLSG